jgi:hypothetical protein
MAVDGSPSWPMLPGRTDALFSSLALWSCSVDLAGAHLLVHWQL